jgi:FKBP-type peptidyl-prolyl cis-trans isomerase
MRFEASIGLGLCIAIAASGSAHAAPVSLPGVQYEVLGSGPPGGAQPKRSDEVQIRYVGRLTDGSVFSTSADNGAGLSTFGVRQAIPGFQALIQLMRPGDRWRFTMPGYLAYGMDGRRAGAVEANLKRDVPPDATLIFDVELVAITPAK